MKTKDYESTFRRMGLRFAIAAILVSFTAMLAGCDSSMAGIRHNYSGPYGDGTVYYTTAGGPDYYYGPPPGHYRHSGKKAYKKYKKEYKKYQKAQKKYYKQRAKAAKKYYKHHKHHHDDDDD